MPSFTNNLHLINFLAGGGGVGKTFLIKAISQWAEKILRQPGDDAVNPKVLLLGPTGKSASLIGKFYYYLILLDLIL